MAKKKLALTMLSLMAIGTLAACGGGENPGPKPTESSKEETPTTSEVADNGLDAKIPENLKDLECEVTFWHSMGKANMAVLDEFITGFNKVFPKIKITHSAQGGYDDVRKNVANAIPAGTTPTMAYCYPDHVADYLPSDSVLKLDEFMSSKKIGFGVDNGLGDLGTEDFIPTYLDEGNHYTVKGVAVDGYYSLPFSKSTEVLFYNKTQFEANGWTVPTTWDQMWALCADIKGAYPEVTPLGYDSDANFYITYCEQMKIPYTTGEGTNHFLFNNDKAKAFVSQLKEYGCGEGMKGYWTSQAQLGSGTYTSTKFTSEELMMSIGSTGGTSYNATDAFETGVAAVPQADLNNGKVIMQGPSICFLANSTIQERVGGWLFYKYITNTTNSAYWASKTGYNPVRTSSFTDKNYKTSSTPLVNTVLDFAATGSDYTKWYYTSPAFKGSSAARNEIDSLMAAVLLGTKTVDKAFEDALANCLFAA